MPKGNPDKPHKYHTSGEFQNGHKTNLGKHWKQDSSKPFSKEHKKKIGLANAVSLKGKQNNKGKHWKLSEKSKKNISDGAKRLVKEGKHPLWKGGITSLNQQIRHLFQYRQWRSDIFTRDDFTCVLCGKRGSWIEADHYPIPFSAIRDKNQIKTIEQALSCEELWNINNGRTLCLKCHNKTKRNKIKELE